MYIFLEILSMLPVSSTLHEGIGCYSILFSQDIAFVTVAIELLKSYNFKCDPT